MLHLKQYRESLAAFDEAMKRNSKNYTRPMINKASALLQLGWYEEAEKVVKQVMSYDADAPEACVYKRLILEFPR